MPVLPNANIGSKRSFKVSALLLPSGILEVDDNNTEDNPDDEILAELKKKQQELKALSQHNLSIIKRLHKLAKEEMQKQDLRKKMAAADTEVWIYELVQTQKQSMDQPGMPVLECSYFHKT